MSEEAGAPGLGRRPGVPCFLGAVLAFSWVAPCPAAAKDGIDCEALKTSSAPYQLQMSHSNGGSYPLQVYRGKNLQRMQYAKVGVNLIISRFQANFLSEYQDLAGANVRFTYDRPTDKYIWQQDGRVVTYNTVIDGLPTAGPGFTQTYEVLPDAMMPLGGCSLVVKHYHLRQNSSGKASDQEVWFSPDLDAALRTVEVTTSPDGKMTEQKLEAVGITTDVRPFQ